MKRTDNVFRCNQWNCLINYVLYTELRCAYIDTSRQISQFRLNLIGQVARS